MYMILEKKSLLLIFCIFLFVSVLLCGSAVLVTNSHEKKIPIYSVERTDNKIALTFNCAWGNEDIENILNVLEKHNVKSTFFIVGTWAEKYPEDLLKISNAGHEIAAHSYNHGHYQKMSYAEISEDMDKCDAAIEKIISKDIFLVRGGYGEYNNDVISSCEASGRIYIQWSVDSLDYKAESCEQITKRVLSDTKSGDIILMHTGTNFTADSLDELLTKLTANFSPVTVSELIYNDNFIIDNTGKQKSTAN